MAEFRLGLADGVPHSAATVYKNQLHICRPLKGAEYQRPILRHTGGHTAVRDQKRVTGDG